jgi:hypothetical protein
MQLYETTGKKDQAHKWHQVLNDEKKAGAKVRSRE